MWNVKGFFSLLCTVSTVSCRMSASYSLKKWCLEILACENYCAIISICNIFLFSALYSVISLHFINIKEIQTEEREGLDDCL